MRRRTGWTCPPAVPVTRGNFPYVVALAFFSDPSPRMFAPSAQPPLNLILYVF